MIIVAFPRITFGGDRIGGMPASERAKQRRLQNMVVGKDAVLV
jgi:hypothetical protein